MAVLRNIDRFEARSTFKTWLMRILVNTARTRRMQEARTVCWSSLPGDARRGTSPSAPGAASSRWVRSAPLSGETWSVIRVALEELPERQRTVVILRDVEGWTSEEVAEALDLTAGNQRVLHRGRTRLRELLAPYVAEREPVFVGV